jgi:hypothetical protein
MAYVSTNIAKLALGRALPVGAAPFVIGFGSVFVVCTLLKISYRHNQWLRMIPSGTSFATSVRVLLLCSIDL